MTMSQEEIDNAREEKIINDEYKVWKKNTPFLYDLIVTHALEWPSLTVQWLPEITSIDGGDYEEHKILLGTHTTSSEVQRENNSLMLAKVKLPNTKLGQEEVKEIDKSGYGAFGDDKLVTILQKINTPGEVHRARYMPQNHCIVATKCPTKDVLIFDYTKHGTEPDKDGIVAPQLRLTGHDKEGYGIAWNLLDKGKIISSADDEMVCMWDISGGSKANNTLPALRKMKSHVGIVNDVAWHSFAPTVFGSVGDDKTLKLWDCRKEVVAHSVLAHQSEVNCVAFNPFNEHILCTGSNDKTVALWDMRNLKYVLHAFESHTDSIYHVEWSPHHETILASSSDDRRLNIWDLAKIGAEQTADDSEDGPPELLFRHGGHTDRITDFSWHPTEPWTLSSVADDNVLMAWKMSESIYNEEEPIVEESLLEAS